MGSLNSDPTLAKENGADLRRAPAAGSQDTLSQAGALAALLAAAAADLRSNGQRVRDGLVAVRQCLRRLRELSVPDGITAESAAARTAAAREIDETALMMDGLLETLYILVQSAVLHEDAAIELKEMLEGSRLMAALDSRV